jgi:hypothetical protein
MEKLRNKIKEAVIREELSHRGGGIEIDLGMFTNAWHGEKMSAYQNYLGGGMLGAIQNDCTIDNWEFTQTIKFKLSDVAEELKRYMHDLTNHDDEWESESYEVNQNKAISAY